MNNKAKRLKKGKKHYKNILSNLMICFFLFLMIYSGIKIINYIIDAKQNEKIVNYIEESITVDKSLEENSNSEENYVIDFEKLKQINKDTCRIY